MSSSTIELPVQYRYLPLVATEGSAIVDADTREVTFAFSSESPTQRIDWDLWEMIYEVLSHDPSHANLDRCNSGAAPLLWNHNRDDQRGVVVKAWINQAERRAYTTVRFGRSDAAEQLMQDVNDKIVSNVSFGYRNYEMELTKKAEGDYNTYTSVNWEVLEISFCSIPADPSVGIGRTQEGNNRVLVYGETPKLKSQTLVQTIETRGSMSDGNTAPPESITAEPVVNQSDVAELRRQLDEQNQQIAQMKRREQVTGQFNRLKEQARSLLTARKLTTAAYEEMFGDDAFKRYLEADNQELSQVEFHLKQLEKHGTVPANFGPSNLSEIPLPAPPHEREENGQNRVPDEATAQRLANRAIGGRMVV